MYKLKNLFNSVIRFYKGLKQPSKRRNRRTLLVRGEAPEVFTIREAEIQDVIKLAELHVKTWNETYGKIKGAPGYSTREWQWGKSFNEENDGSWFCLLVENHAGKPVGFAKGVKYTEDDFLEYTGELNKIYLLREYQRVGLGRRLFLEVIRRFLDMNINSMLLFGIPQNPSCAFHEAMGGKRLQGKGAVFQGGYGWKDLRKTLADLTTGKKIPSWQEKQMVSS